MLLDVMSEILFVLERPLAGFAAERLAVAVTLLVTFPKFDRVQHDAAKGTSDEETLQSLLFCCKQEIQHDAAKRTPDRPDDET
jgi:hypothetical protein